MKTDDFNRKAEVLVTITIVCVLTVFAYTRLHHSFIISSTTVTDQSTNRASQIPDALLNELARYPLNSQFTNQDIGKQRLDDAINRSGDYLIRYCNEDGRYLYRTNLNPAVTVKPKYNMLRHAGAIYAVSAYLKQYPSEKGKQALKRSVGFLKETIKPVKDGEDRLAVLSIPEITGNLKSRLTAKLGGSGLGLVALCSANEIIPNLTPTEYLAKLGNFVLMLQHEDGSFVSKYYPEDDRMDLEWASLYYPGEAALGLVMLYEQDGNPKWLQAAANAIAYLARKRVLQNSVEADHWALLATARFLPHLDKCNAPISKEEYIRHAKQIVLSILADGCRAVPDDLVHGSFTSDGRTCPAAIRLEGLLAAFAFIPTSDQLLRTMVKSRLNKGIEFLVKSQVYAGPYSGGIPRAIRPLTLRHPRASESFNNRATEIRVDYVQHALSAMLGYQALFYSGSTQQRKVQPDVDIYLQTKQDVTESDFPDWINTFVHRVPWSYQPRSSRSLTPEMLDQSLRLGSQFLQNNQTAEGNFNYMYNFISKKVEPGDSQVRQAGALWGLTLIYQQDPKPITRDAIMKSINFFVAHTKPGPIENSLLIHYPDSQSCKTGTVALVTLSLIDLLRTEQTLEKPLPDAKTEALSKHLAGYLNYLKYMIMENNHFAEEYDIENQKKVNTFSPYFDGEALLALIKAAKYLGHDRLVPQIEVISLTLAKYYTIDAWHVYYDSDQTKSFSQWGCMSFAEYSTTKWKQAACLKNSAIALGWWLVFVHHVLDRNRNTAYAFEGILHACKLAQDGHPKAEATLKQVINDGLLTLTSWQVGGPLAQENQFLRKHPTLDLLALGGVMNGTQDPFLRIDVTQHQMHAVILALNTLFQK